MEERLAAVPNAFYDFIVFITPTLIVVMGFSVGFAGIDWIPHIGAPPDFNTLLAVLLLGVVASYEYGRIAETWSAYLVQSPLRWVALRGWGFKDQDFLRSHQEIYKYLGLENSKDGRAGDKWVLYFYAMGRQPKLGADLLKRYAWEKLSRSSALSYAVLLFSSLVVGSLYLMRIVDLPAGRWGLGGWVFTLVSGLLAATTYIEYYRRNCWNYDLLVKTAPVLKVM